MQSTETVNKFLDRLAVETIRRAVRDAKYTDADITPDEHEDALYWLCHEGAQWLQVVRDIEPDALRRRVAPWFFKRPKAAAVEIPLFDYTEA